MVPTFTKQSLLVLKQVAHIYLPGVDYIILIFINYLLLFINLVIYFQVN